METLSELVLDSELETRFTPEHTVHIHPELDSNARRQAAYREESWRRQGVIGRGAYAKVWREICVSKGEQEARVRAVKEIVISQRDFRPVNYNRELEAIAKFSHRKYEHCFIKSLGWYRDENAHALYIAMEYLELGDLQTYLNSVPPLDEQAAREITSQLVEALHFMHKNHYAHRDLKPGNILVKSRPPDFWWVKLGDFGLSKKVEENQQDPGSTTIKGTPGFIAPELRGFTQRGTDYEADMWSLGEVAFRLLTKEPTFNDAALFRYIQDSQFLPKHKLCSRGASTIAVDFISGCMAPIPQDRRTAEVSMNHEWRIQPILSTPATQHTINESDVPLSVSSLTEDFASWTTNPAAPTADASTIRHRNNVSAEHRSFGTLAGFRNFRNKAAVEPTRELHNATPINPNGIFQSNKSSQALSYSYLQNGGPCQFIHHEGPVAGVAISPDGRMSASCGWGSERDPCMIRVWSLTSRKEQQCMRAQGTVSSVAFSPDGRLVACGGSDWPSGEGSILLYDPATGLQLRRLAGHSKAVTSIAFAPDGKTIVCSYAQGSETEGVARFWSVSTGRELGRVLGSRSSSVFRVAYSPDGSHVVCCGKDVEVRIWILPVNTINAAENRSSIPPGSQITEMRSFIGRPGDVTGIAFSRDGKTLAGSVWEYSYWHGRINFGVRLWDVETGRQGLFLEGFTDCVFTVAFSPTNNVVAGGGHNGVRLWNSRTGHELRHLNRNLYQVQSLNFSSDGSLLAIAALSEEEKGFVQLWNVRTHLFIPDVS